VQPVTASAPKDENDDAQSTDTLVEMDKTTTLFDKNKNKKKRHRVSKRPPTSATTQPTKKNKNTQADGQATVNTPKVVFDDTKTKETLQCLTCQTCQQYVSSPIFQCREGHPICGPCQLLVVDSSEDEDYSEDEIIDPVSNDNIHSSGNGTSNTHRCKACAHGVRYGTLERNKNLEHMAQGIKVSCIYCKHMTPVSQMRDHTCQKFPFSCISLACKEKFRKLSQFTAHVQQRHAIDVVNHSMGAVFSHTFNISHKFESNGDSCKSMFVFNKNNAILVDINPCSLNTTTKTGRVLIVQCWHIHRAYKYCSGKFSPMDIHTNKPLHTYYCKQLKNYSSFHSSDVESQNANLSTALIMPVSHVLPSGNTLPEQGGDDGEGKNGVAFEIQFQFNNIKR
jgi:hypothetical protein